MFFVVFNVEDPLKRVVLPVYMNGGDVKYHGYDVITMLELDKYATVSINDVAHLFDVLYNLVDDFGKVTEK
jgi:hypothetical protein